MSEIFNILIADNNRNIRDLLKREMKVAGHKVRLSKSAEEVFSIMDYQWVLFKIAQTLLRLLFSFRVFPKHQYKELKCQ
jgi:DNA-binding NtrC family response regulator